MKEKSKKSKKGLKKVVFAIILVAAGVLLLMKNFNYIDSETIKILFSWKMILIAIGVIQLSGRDFITGIILITVGLYFILSKYFCIPFSFMGIVFPLILITIGLSIFFGHNKFNCQKHSNSFEENDFFEESVIFGGVEKFYKTDCFRGAKISTIFGGAKINMQQVELSSEKNIIDISCIFGGCELIIPSDWNIDIRVNNILGGIADKRNPSLIDTNKVIIIQGKCILGGCEIKSL